MAMLLKWKTFKFHLIPSNVSNRDRGGTLKPAENRLFQSLWRNKKEQFRKVFQVFQCRDDDIRKIGGEKRRGGECETKREVWKLRCCIVLANLVLWVRIQLNSHCRDDGTVRGDWLTRSPDSPSADPVVNWPTDDIDSGIPRCSVHIGLSFVLVSETTLKRIISQFVRLLKLEQSLRKHRISKLIVIYLANTY